MGRALSWIRAPNIGLGLELLQGTGHIVGECRQDHMVQGREAQGRLHGVRPQKVYRGTARARATALTQPGTRVRTAATAIST